MIALSAPQQAIHATIQLSGSKSISNRLLVLKQLLDLNITLTNLSDSEDTQLLQEALFQLNDKNEGIMDVRHAGTDLRFLTALLASRPGRWTLTGSQRMKERPVGELVQALRALGAEITFTGKENYPPLWIRGKKLKGGAISINSSISSQFISALLLVAPGFENGLRLSLNGEIVSKPYIEMTLAALNTFGIAASWLDREIYVPPVSMPLSIPHSFPIESDWSSASYWYSICALSEGSEITLRFLSQNSWQADSVLPELYSSLGVETRFTSDGVLLTSIKPSCSLFRHDFTNCPDIAQTLAVTCFALGIPAELTGLSTLKVKETDRIFALKTELEKLGAEVVVTDESIELNPKSKIQNPKSGIQEPGTRSQDQEPDTRYKAKDERQPELKTQNKKPEIGTRNQDNKSQEQKQETRNKKQDIIRTYNDHRMAMSFAPLALVYPELQIEAPEVVAKSYPRFWEDLKSVGFNVNLRP